MSRSLSLQVYVSPELGARVREAANAKGMTVSEWLRLLIDRSCDEDAGTPSLERVARQSVFLMVGIDALLAGHPDHALRDRAHQAYARKLRELGLAPASGGGGGA